MYVARSRQKPPENAFQMRSRMKAEQEAEAEAKESAKRFAKKASVNDQAPDLDALREAAARAAALVHGTELEAELKVLEDMRGVEVTASTVDEDKVIIDAPEPTRGRPASSTVAERTARILELITESGTEGISKPDLAAAVETKEANVQVALGKLKDAGKVESRRLPDTGKYRWFAV